MYVTIRRYKLAGSGAELLQRVRREFLPIIDGMPGLCGYYIIDCGGAEAMSITFWAEKHQAEHATIVARDWVAKSAIGLIPFSPDQISGDVVFETTTTGAKPMLEALARSRKLNFAG